MAKFGVRVNKKLWDKIVKVGFSPKDTNKYVVVGISADKGSQTHKSDDNSITEQGAGDVTVLDVAMWNHYGTSNIPARPFLAQPIKDNETEILKLYARLANLVISLKISHEQALKLLGEKGRAIVLTAINNGFPPSNAESTIAAKGSSKPLINTGQLKGSIVYEIRDGS